MAGRDLLIIGERINPGFRSSKAFFDNSDFEGIQNLAIKQADAGASYLNINIGSRALDDFAFMHDSSHKRVTLIFSFGFISQIHESNTVSIPSRLRTSLKTPNSNSAA